MRELCFFVMFFFIYQKWNFIYQKNYKKFVTSEREARSEFLLIYTKNMSMSGRPAGRGHAFERLISLEP